MKVDELKEDDYLIPTEGDVLTAYRKGRSAQLGHIQVPEGVDHMAPVAWLNSELGKRTLEAVETIKNRFTVRSRLMGGMI